MDLMDYRRKIIANSPHLKSASGAVASFSDGADLPLKSLNVGIEPVQDLRGYDSPWVGGSGKNLLPPFSGFTNNGLTTTANSDGSITVTGTATGSGGYITDYVSLARTVSSGTTVAISVKNNVPSKLRIFPDSGTADISANSNSTVYTPSADMTKMRLYLFTTSGTSYNFTIYPMLEIGNSATDYAPYENICPISGWNGVKVTRCGKNLFDKSVFADYSNWIHPINTSGFGTDNTNKGCLLPKLKANTYTISFDWDTTFPTYLYLCKVNANGYGTLVAHLTTNIIKSKKITFTLAEGERAYLRMGSTVDITYFNDNFAKFGNCMLEKGSTATPYEPYNGVNVSINLGQTVYGGTLNVLTGVLTVDRAIVDLGTLNWTRINTQSPHWRFWAIPSVQMLQDSTLVSTQYVQITPSVQWLGFIGVATQLITGVPAIMVSDERYETAADFKTAMSGVQLVYELATPYEIQLTPHQIRSLYGNNTIFADTGNVALEYWAHP